jgi:hypothetical protein
MVKVALAAWFTVWVPGVMVPLAAWVTVIVCVSVAKLAVTETPEVTLVSVLGFATDPSLQLTKWYPVFGTAVTAEPLAPAATLWGVVPEMEPLGPAVYVSVNEVTVFDAKAAVTLMLAVTFVSVLGFRVDPSLQLTKWYPVLALAVTADPLAP